MDIAIVLSGHRHGKRGADLMLRPFAESTLLEHAMGKLQGLDAPCAKYVACADRTVKNLASQFDELRTIRASHLLGWVDADATAKRFSHLRTLPETHILVVNPAFPLVEADLWWQVIEDFLSCSPQGIVSAEAVCGPFYLAGGQPLTQEGPEFVGNDAFMLISRRSIDRQLTSSTADFSPYILSADIARSVESPHDLVAAEAILTLSRLELSV